MERLEAAITKARQQKAGYTRSQRPVSGQTETIAPLPEAWGALPELALKPKILKRNRVVTLEATPEATPFDILRTRTLRQFQENGWRRLAITSPTPGCGKSTLALNLALSLARQPGLRTIGIEMDMRRPSQERILGLPTTTGEESAVARLMTGNASFGAVARRPRAGLAIATSGTAVNNASDILLHAGVGDIVQRIDAEYAPDIMIFDMPPALLSDDTLAFMQHVDCALIVAAAEDSTITEIDSCERELASQTNVLGVALNKCRLSSAETSSYGYY